MFFGIKVAAIFIKRKINELYKILTQKLRKNPETSKAIPKSRWFYFNRDYRGLDYSGYFGLGGCIPV